MNFFRSNTSRNNDFPPFAVFGNHEFGNGFRRTHSAMSLIVMAHPHRFLIWNAKINSGHHSATTSLQLPQPLMRDKEITSDRDGKDTAGNLLPRAPRTIDAVSTHATSRRFRSKIHKHCHGTKLERANV